MINPDLVASVTKNKRSSLLIKYRELEDEDQWIEKIEEKTNTGKQIKISAI